MIIGLIKYNVQVHDAVLSNTGKGQAGDAKTQKGNTE